MAFSRKSRFARRALAILPVLLMAATGCNSSPRSPFPAQVGMPGMTVVPPLTGLAASNHTVCVDYLRHLPRNAAFIARTFTNAGHPPLHYLLFRPENIQTNTRYPLVLSLHGGAPRRNFEDLLEPYLPGLAYGLGRLVSLEAQSAHPNFVVAPWSNNQSWDDANLRLVMALLISLEREFPIDSRRRYVTGQSMGGFGTWSAVTLFPNYFAAAVPICGGGDPPLVKAPWQTPVWAFHGDADGVVPVNYTREMIAAVRHAGGVPVYHEYSRTDHAGAAERAYCEPGLIEWLFAQARP
jgi:predicted peptidase